MSKLVINYFATGLFLRRGVSVIVSVLLYRGVGGIAAVQSVFPRNDSRGIRNVSTTFAGGGRGGKV